MEPEFGRGIVFVLGFMASVSENVEDIDPYKCVTMDAVESENGATTYRITSRVCSLLTIAQWIYFHTRPLNVLESSTQSILLVFRGAVYFGIRQNHSFGYLTHEM